jgi:hypothetical protein
MLGLEGEDAVMTNAPAPMLNEENRRAAPRRRVAKAAKLAFGDFVFVLDCSVRDVGPDGARIRIASAHEVPEEFHLIFLTDRSMRKARAVWRTDVEIGVRYLEEASNLMQNSDPRLRQFQFV